MPAERTARLIAMLLGIPVSAGFVDKASTRLDARLQEAGFDGAMQAALAREPVLGADETPVSVLTPATGPGAGETEDGSPHVLIIRPPRREADLAAGAGIAAGRRDHRHPRVLHRFLITDGYAAYQQLLPKVAGIQQCCAHIIRRCRAVTKLGPGGAQSWAGEVITILRQAHTAVEDARSRGQPAHPDLIEDLRDRYNEAVRLGITLNRLRDWDGDGNHPGYTLGCWLRDYANQVWLFTRDPAVEWTNNTSERGAKAAKRHQAVSGYWHTQQTLARWCRIRSYLDSATAHGLAAPDAISAALAGKPWQPPITPAAQPTAA